MATPNSQKKLMLIRQLYLRDGDKCFYCNRALMVYDEIEQFPLGRLPTNYPTIEHVIPVALGGGNKLKNLRLACPPCNNSKSHRVTDIDVNVNDLTETQAKDMLARILYKYYILDVEVRALRSERKHLSSKLGKVYQETPQELRAEIKELKNKIKTLNREINLLMLYSSQTKKEVNQNEWIY